MLRRNLCAIVMVVLASMQIPNVFGMESVKKFFGSFAREKRQREAPQIPTHRDPFSSDDEGPEAPPLAPQNIPLVPQPVALTYDITALEALKTGCKDMRGKNLRGAPLQNLIIEDVDFTDAILDGANCTDATMNRAHFSHTSLNGTIFEKTKLNHAKFLNSTTAVRAVFEFTELNHARMKESIFSYALFNACSDGDKKYVTQMLTIEDCNFFHAAFVNMKLNDSSIKISNFRECIFKDVFFDHCALEHICMTQANIELLRIAAQTTLSHIDFTSATIKNLFATNPVAREHDWIFGDNINFSSTKMYDCFFIADVHAGFKIGLMDKLSTIFWYGPVSLAESPSSCGRIIGCAPIATYLNATFSRETELHNVLFLNISFLYSTGLGDVRDAHGSNFDNVLLKGIDAHPLKSVGAMVNAEDSANNNSPLRRLITTSSGPIGSVVSTLIVTGVKAALGIPAA